MKITRFGKAQFAIFILFRDIVSQDNGRYSGISTEV